MLNFPEINPVALKIGVISVRWYGLMYLIGFYLTYYLGLQRISHHVLNPLTRQEFENFLFYGMLGAILGGRIGYILFYYPSYYIHRPIKIFCLWEGGMSFHGGIIGVSMVIAIYSYFQNKSFFRISDFISLIVPPAFAFGRFGNFLNGELWGRPTNLPWGMVFPNSGDLIARHPSQLYESILEGIILFMLMNRFSKTIQWEGKNTAIFLMSYGFLRFLVEFLRQPDDYLNTFPFEFSLGQWLSLPMIVLGLIIYLWKNTSYIFPLSLK